MSSQVNCCENYFERSDCTEAMKELHEWVKSVSIAAADFALSCGNSIGLTEIDSYSLASAINQSVYDNVRLNGIPEPLMNELRKHTEQQIKEKR